MQLNKCKKCGIEKTEDMFDRAYSKSNKSDLRRKTCKECRSVYHKAYRDDNRDKMRERDMNKYWSRTDEERSEYIKQKSLSNSKREGIKDIRREYNNSPKGKYVRYKNDANRRSRSYKFDITLVQFTQLIESNCYYCGKPNAGGVDRSDNTVGYIIENCVPCCKVCNEMKMDKTVMDFINQCKIIAKKWES